MLCRALIPLTNIIHIHLPFLPGLKRWNTNKAMHVNAAVTTMQTTATAPRTTLENEFGVSSFDCSWISVKYKTSKEVISYRMKYNLNASKSIRKEYLLGKHGKIGCKNIELRGKIKMESL